MGRAGWFANLDGRGDYDYMDHREQSFSVEKELISRGYTVYNPDREDAGVHEVDVTNCAFYKLKLVANCDKKMENWEKVWLNSLTKSKDTGGFVQQVVVRDHNGNEPELGKGQKKELNHANAFGVRVEKKEVRPNPDREANPSKILEIGTTAGAAVGGPLGAIAGAGVGAIGFGIISAFGAAAVDVKNA